MWRRLIIATAVIGGIVAGCVVALKSPRVAHNIKTRLQTLAHEQAGVRLEIAHFELELLPLGLSFGGVEVFRPDEEAPWITLHSGNVQVRPWPSAAGAIVVEHLELDGLRGTIDLDVDTGADGGEAQSEDDSGLTVDVRELLIWNADLQLASGERTVRLERTDLTMLPAPQGGRRIKASIEAGTVEQGDETFGFEGKAQALFEGTLDRPERINIERSRLFLKRIALSGGGRVELKGDPQLHLTIDGGIDLAQVRELAPDAPALDGRATVKAELKGTPAEPLLRGALKIDDLEVEGKLLGDIEADAVYLADQVNLESFKVAHPQVGTVTGSGTVDLAKGLPVTYTTRLHRVSLPHILELVDEPGAWVELVFSGDVQGDGRLMPLGLSFKMDGTVEEFVVNDRPFREPEREPRLALVNATVKGPARITERAISIWDYEVGFGESKLMVEATFTTDLDVGMDLRASGDAVNLADLGSVAGVEFFGVGAIAGTVEGPYGRNTIAGSVEIDNLRVFDHLLGDTKATIIFEPFELKIDRAVIRRGRGTTTGAGSFILDQSPPKVQGAFELENMNLGDLLVSIGAAPSLSRRFDADVSGRLLLSGDLTLPDGITSLKAPAATIDGVAMGPMVLEGGFGPGEERLWGTLALAPGKGTLSGRMVLKEDMTTTIEGTMDTIDFATLRPFMGNPKLEGRVSMRADLAGPVDGLSGQVAASAIQFVAYGLNLGTTRVLAKATDGKLALSGDLLGGRAELEGGLTLNKMLPYSITTTFEDLRIDTIFTLPNQYGVVGSGTLFSQGKLADPDTMIADVVLNEAKLNWRALVLSPVRPIRINYSERRFDFPEVSLKGPGITASLGGRTHLDGRMDLHLIGQGDLALMTQFVERLESARGPFKLDLEFGGRTDAPELGGSIEIRGATARFSGMDKVIEQIRADVRLAGRSIEIRGGTATAGDGTMKFSGDVVLGEDGPAQVDMRGRFVNVSTRPYPDVTLTASGELNLLGPSNDLELKGSMDIGSLQYVPRLLELQNLVPRRDAPPLRVPTFQPGESLALRIAVQAPNNILISSSVIDAELSAELLLTGTTERIGVLGSVRPIWARARYRDSVFEVEQAQIDFTEEYSINTEFDVVARTQACKMDVRVNIVGDSSKLEVFASGRDEEGDVEHHDVLNCLATGHRLKDFDRSVLQGEGQWIVTDIVAEVSGVNAQIQRLVPVDELRLTSGQSNKTGRIEPRFEIAQKLGDKLVLKESFSLLEPDDHEVSLQYELSDHATIQGGWVSATDDIQVGDFGLDLRLRWELE